MLSSSSLLAYIYIIVHIYSQKKFFCFPLKPNRKNVNRYVSMYFDWQEFLWLDILMIPRSLYTNLLMLWGLSLYMISRLFEWCFCWYIYADNTFCKYDVPILMYNVWIFKILFNLLLVVIWFCFFQVQLTRVSMRCVRSSCPTL